LGLPFAAQVFFVVAPVIEVIEIIHFYLAQDLL